MKKIRKCRCVRRHETVRVTCGKYMADIDAKIAPLIRECWRLGIQTIACCEEPPSDPGYAFILFGSFDDADLFVKAVGIRKPIELIRTGFQFPYPGKDVICLFPAMFIPGMLECLRMVRADPQAEVRVVRRMMRCRKQAPSPGLVPASSPIGKARPLVALDLR